MSGAGQGYARGSRWYTPERLRWIEVRKRIGTIHRSEAQRKSDAVRYPAPPEHVARARDELVRDFFVMTDERRRTLIAVVGVYARQVRPPPARDRRSNKPFSAEKTLRLAAEHCWGCPSRILLENE